MEVILNKDVDKIGKAGTVAQVKEGFARNFLFPHNLAKPATAASLKKLEQEKQARDAQSAKTKAELLVLANRLGKLSLSIPVLAQNEEKLYGSISAQDICESLKKEGFSINKNLIDLAEPIKSLGTYEIKIKLHPEITASLKLCVLKASA